MSDLLLGKRFGGFVFHRIEFQVTAQGLEIVAIGKDAEFAHGWNRLVTSLVGAGGLVCRGPFSNLINNIVVFWTCYILGLRSLGYKSWR
jgi:hypothetical protein